MAIPPLDYRSRLLLVAEAYREARRLSLARISTQVRNDGKFFDRIKGGGGLHRRYL